MRKGKTLAVPMRNVFDTALSLCLAKRQITPVCRGLLLFIDEAEAFLGKRSSAGMSEDTRNALNALLYNTGSASRRLMMVLATNRAEVRHLKAEAKV